jgi:ubiquinone/menaquinone biosynthesis C-methylase UbiE
MYLPELVKSIRPGDRVLEVGPGGSPHARSNVLLDKKFSDPEEAFLQRSRAKELKHDKRLVYYGGGRFPFRDGAFDYVICSHVIEHIPAAELPVFIAELERVAGRGYLEFPRVFYELLSHDNCHHWIMNLRGQKILLLDRKRFEDNCISRACAELFFGADRQMYKAFRRYREFFFCGFEWERKIDYEIVSDYTALFGQEDLDAMKRYLARFEPGGDLAPPRGLRALAEKAMWVVRHPWSWASGKRPSEG